MFYVPDTPPQELSLLSPKRNRYSEEEVTTDLYLMFSNLPRSTIDCVIDVAENASKVFNILLNGVKSFPLIAESQSLDGSCVTLTVSQDSVLNDAIAYYIYMRIGYRFGETLKGLLKFSNSCCSGSTNMIMVNRLNAIDAYLRHARHAR